MSEQIFQPNYVEVMGHRVGNCSVTCPARNQWQPDRCEILGPETRASVGSVCLPWMLFQMQQKDASLRIGQAQCARAQRDRDSYRDQMSVFLRERDDAREEVERLRILLHDLQQDVGRGEDEPS